MNLFASARHSKFLLIGALLIALAVPVALLVGRTAIADPIPIPAGTRIAVRLQETVSSKGSASGQEFTAVLDEPIVVNEKMVAPRGAAAYGRVATARPSGRLRTPAALYLRLTAIEMNGKLQPVATNLVGRSGPSHKKRNLAWIGGGGGVGAAIGAIAAGGTGAAIGAGAGAGAGTLTAFFTGKKNIVYPVETRLLFRLSNPAVVQ